MLRLTMLWRFRANWGYDADVHWAYVDWILQRRSFPPW